MAFKHFKHLNVPDSWERYFTKYPQGMTILEALFEWVSQVDSMVDNQNKLNDNVEQFRTEIDAFIGRFDDRLQDEVTQTLTDWQNSGFLDVVISEALQWQLTDYIATNEADKLSLTTQLAQTQKKLMDSALSPDDYEGTDFEKVQSSINDAISMKKGIKLARIYDITNTQPIMIDNSPGRWTLEFTGEGGGIKKTNEGFMFSSNDSMSADINFNSVKFESVPGRGTVVFDADKLLIINTLSCVFSGVDSYAKTTKYMQSYRSNMDRVTGGQGYFIETPSVYDLSVSDILVEVRESFFKQTKAPVGNEWDSLYGARFKNTVIEGLSGEAFRIRKTELLSIDGAYFEMNGTGNIVFDNDADRLAGVSISNTRAYESAENPLPLINWGGFVNNAKTYNNRTNNAPVHNTTNITNGNIISEKDVSGVPGFNDLPNIDPGKHVYKLASPSVTKVDGVNVVAIGHLIKLNKTSTTQLPMGSSPTVVQCEFNQEIYRDDIISVQTYSSNQNYIVNHYLRNPANKKIVDVYITNNANGELNITMDVTVLKLSNVTSQVG